MTEPALTIEERIAALERAKGAERAARRRSDRLHLIGYLILLGAIVVGFIQTDNLSADRSADNAAAVRQQEHEDALTAARTLISGDLTRDDFVNFVVVVIQRLTPGDTPREKALVKRIRGIGHDFFPDRRCLDLEDSTPAICAQARTEVLRQRALQGQPPARP